jgi:hypothetical protein
MAIKRPAMRSTCDASRINSEEGAFGFFGG